MKVSIIIPVYNGSKFVSEAIQTAIDQSYKDIEIVVVNDGSTDHGLTKKLVQPFLPYIKYFEKKNGGVASALNFGIQQSTGDYISWLSHDDLYHPDKIKDQLSLLEKNNFKGVAVCRAQFIDAKGSLLSVISSEFISAVPMVQVFLSSSIHGCALLIPKKIFNEVGYFNENLKFTQDYDLWFRISEFENFHFQDEILVFSRLHEGQGSRKFQYRNKLSCDALRFRFALKMWRKNKLTTDLVERFINFSFDNRLPLSFLFSLFLKIRFSLTKMMPGNKINK
jgi:glycosyltransferase involved in cell wall biosynthesis